VNTGASTLLVLTALLLLGGDSLADFARARALVLVLVLVLGIVAGTVSTVSVAVPLTVADPPLAPACRTPTATARRGSLARRDGAVL
jgi:SecD/SecF fusion protein